MSEPRPLPHGASPSLMAFLAMTFAIVGLTGLFATFAAPLPLERALARDAALDEALAGPGTKEALATLHDRLDDSAAAIGPGQDLAARVAAERLAMHARLIAESEATSVRLRWLICVVTLTGAAFGIAMMRLVSRRPG